jgi:O-antigen/teichoic acid export membrane protein
LEVLKIVNSLRSRLVKQAFFKNVLIIASGTAVSHLIIFLSSLILTRLYPVADFGYFQYYQSILGFLIVIGSLRYDFAVLVADNEAEIFNIGTLALAIISSITLFLFLILIFVSVTGIQIPGMPPGLWKYVWIAPISFFCASLYQLLCQMLVRFSNFKLISTTKVTQSIGLSATQLSVPFFTKGAAGLFIGDVVGKICGISSVLKWVLKYNKSALHNISKTNIRKVASKYKNYAIYSTPGTLLNSLGLYLPNLFFAALFGFKMLGAYSIAEKVFTVPFLLIGQSIAQVYTAKVREMIQDDATTLPQFFRKIVFRTGFFLIIPMAAFVFVSPALFEFFFGTEWRLAGEIASIMVLMQFFGFMSGITTFTLIILKKQKLQLLWEGLRMVSIVSLFMLIRYYKWEMNKSLLLYSATMAFFYLLHLFLSYYSIVRIATNTQKSRPAY